MNAFPGSRWRLAGCWLAAAFPVLALVLDKAASTIFAIFFLAGLWLLVTRRAEKPAPDVRWLLVAFTAYFLVGVLSFAFGEQTRLGEKLLGRDIRFLGAVVAWFALAAVALPEHWLRRAMAVGGIVTGAVAVIQTWLAADPDYRAGGETISIVFGHLSVLLFAANLAWVLFERRGRGAGIAALLLAALAVVLSGTRGALLSLLAVLAVALVFVALRGGRPRTRSVVAAVLVGIVVTVAGAGWLAPRVEEGWREWQAYADVEQAVHPRGCLADAHELDRLLRFGAAYGGVRADVAAWRPGIESCDGEHAIRLYNDSESAGSWKGPYRSVPVGARGAVIAAGTGQIRVGEKTLPIDNRTAASYELPAVDDLARSEFRVRLAPGETLWLIPVEMHSGEYAFAGANSSIGTRLMMWSTALGRIDADPLGSGPGSWPLIAADEAYAGRIAWRLADYDHAHSDYLTVLLERGWLGLLALLAVLAAPAAWAARGGDSGIARRAGVAFVATAAAVSALTETVFNHSIGITYYCALVLLFVTARPQPSHTADPHSHRTRSIP